MAFKTLGSKPIKIDGSNSPVTGFLLSVTTGIGKNQSTIYQLQSEKGDSIRGWGGTVLDAQLLTDRGELNPLARNRLVKITYFGEADGGQGPYHNYKIEVDSDRRFVDQEPAKYEIIDTATGERPARFKKRSKKLEEKT